MRHARFAKSDSSSIPSSFPTRGYGDLQRRTIAALACGEPITAVVQWSAHSVARGNPWAWLGTAIGTRWREADLRRRVHCNLPCTSSRVQCSREPHQAVGALCDAPDSHRVVRASRHPPPGVGRLHKPCDYSVVRTIWYRS